MKEWFNFQERLYRRVQDELKSVLKKKTKAIANYEAEYLKDQKSYELSHIRSLYRSLRESDFVFIGDFHSLKQSQRLVLRLLRDPKVRKPQCLALELIPPEIEERIRELCEKPNKKRELELFQKLKLEEEWGSSSEIYLEIFRQAYEHNIQIVGLDEGRTGLKIRDRKAARRLAKLESKTWVLMGAFHCARAHLPQELQKLRPEVKISVLQQNDDRLGLKYLKKLEHRSNLIFKAPKKKSIELFCILHTPLWVKWQSYLDAHNSLEESRIDFNAQDQIIWSVQTLAQFLEDPRYPWSQNINDLIDFAVITMDDDNFHSSLRKTKTKERRRLLQELEIRRTAISSDLRRVYLSEVTINSCAQAAGAYLHRCLSGSTATPKDFFLNVWIEAVSFFLSKLLNHSRKAKHWVDWEALAENSLHAKHVLKSRSFVQHLHDHKLWAKSFKSKAPEVSRDLARVLADSAFEAFLAGEFSKQRLNRLILKHIDSETEAFEHLVELKLLGESFLRKQSQQW